MKYKETRHKGIYVTEDGGIYSDYISGKMTKKKFVIIKGIKYVHYKSSGKKIRVNVRKEVALAFIENPDNLMYTRYKSNDPSDTSVSNIYWPDHSMDYSLKTNYVNYKDSVYGHFRVEEDNGNTLMVSCITCKDTKEILRGSIYTLGECSICKEYPIPDNYTDTSLHENWDIIDFGNIKDPLGKKKLKLQCKCCGEIKKISLGSYKNRMTPISCNRIKKLKNKAYTAFTNMLSRCYNKSNNNWVNIE